MSQHYGFSPTPELWLKRPKTMVLDGTWGNTVAFREQLEA